MQKIINKILKIKLLFVCFFSKKKILILNTPVHGNLGDHAITLGEKKFARLFFSDYKAIEVEESLCTDTFLQVLSYFINQTDLIFLQGGFMGDLWPSHEIVMLKIIKILSKHNKVIMPQTCYLQDNSQESINQYRKKYEDAENLLFIFRDKKSYDFFTNNIIDASKCRLYPDIALILSSPQNIKRSGLLLCLREDKEQILNYQNKSQIINSIAQISKKLSKTSTVIEQNISPRRREFFLNKKLDEFAKAEIVITDRLHGMIFATITGTPCIAFDNLSNKVSGVYEWIMDQSYVKCIDFDRCGMEEAEEIVHIHSGKYTQKRIMCELKHMRDDIFDFFKLI